VTSSVLTQPASLGALRARSYPLWVGGGTLAVVVVLALGWFLLIQPQKARTSSLRDEVDTAQTGVAQLQQQLAKARQENGDLTGYQQKLVAARAALPTTAALSTFLRDVESAGTAAGVDVRSLIVGTPAQVTGISAQIYALPITLTAAGSASKLDTFLTQVQRVQPRAVLVNTVNAAPDENSVSLSGTVTMTLGLRAFVAPTTSTSSTSSTSSTGSTTTAATAAPTTTAAATASAAPTTAPSASPSASASASAAPSSAAPSAG
jgi:Tfp pilus assembly protein PilO